MHWTKLNRTDVKLIYQEALKAGNKDFIRQLCREDLFFLLFSACNRKDMDNDWLYARCQEVQERPDGYLDLWFREGYKSTIITFGKTIQDILIDQEETFGIFSHTRPIAKAFLEQIKREFEVNEFLKAAFDDILWQDPQKEAPKWSLDGGIVVKRKSNPKEATIEAHGLVDGQPTSKHFGTLVYDDVVTRESVTSPEMIEKVTDGWALSLNLGSDRVLDDGTTRPCRKRYSGTRYHHSDTYKTILERGSAIPRTYYPTELGQKDVDALGKPVLFSELYLRTKRKDMGIYIYGCQMLQDPTADKAAGFHIDWLRHYNFLNKSERWNFYLICDPANEKKKASDYTVMTVIGMADDQNYYLVDGIRDKLNLTERTSKLFEFHRKWNIKAVGYEKYGKDSDIAHIEYVMEQEGYRFSITPLGGPMPKNDRIRRLVPIFEQGRFYLPHKLLFQQSDGKAADFIYQLENDEYINFPVGSHDDMLDCIARITDEDLMAVFPKKKEPELVTQAVKEYDPMAVPTH